MIRENSGNAWNQKKYDSWTPAGVNNGHINFDNDQIRKKSMRK